MNERRRIRLAKLADEHIGTSLVRILAARLPSDQNLRKVRKILFVKFWGLGSLVLTEPAIRRLRCAFPGAEVHYLTLRRNAQLLELFPQIDRVHTLPFSTFVSLGAASLGALRSLRREDYDLILDAEFFSNYSAVVAHLVAPSDAGIVGFARPASAKSRLQTVSLPFRSDTHVCAQFLQLVGAADNRGLTSAAFSTQPRLRSRGQEFLSRRLAVSRSRPYIVVNVNASALARERRWPRQAFVELARSLLDRYPLDLAFIGCRRERQYVEGACREMKGSERVKNLCGQTSVAELCALLQGSFLLISNDSGPVHLASAFDVPVVAFYGPETPALYGPLGRQKLVFYEGLSCSPCMSVDNAKTVNCTNNRACMKTISPRRVVAAVHEFMDHSLLGTSSLSHPPLVRTGGS